MAAEKGPSRPLSREESQGWTSLLSKSTKQPCLHAMIRIHLVKEHTANCN